MNDPLPPLVRRRVRRVALAWLAVATLAGFTILALAHRQHWGLGVLVYLIPLLSIGAIVLTFWMVFAPWHLLTRWVQTLAAAALALAGASLGESVAAGRFAGMEEPLRTWLATPLFLLIASWPLWALRAALGIRLIAADEPPAAEPRSGRQFSIGDLAVAMFVVAVSLGLIRTAVALESRGNAASQQIRTVRDLREILTGGLMFSVLILSVAIPCAWAALGTRRRLRAAALLALYAVIFVLGLCGWQYWDSGGRRFFDPVVALMGTSILALVYISLWPLRQAGLALRRPRNRTRKSERTFLPPESEGTLLPPADKAEGSGVPGSGASGQES